MTPTVTEWNDSFIITMGLRTANVKSPVKIEYDREDEKVRFSSDLSWPCSEKHYRQLQKALHRAVNKRRPGWTYLPWPAASAIVALLITLTAIVWTGNIDPPISSKTGSNSVVFPSQPLAIDPVQPELPATPALPGNRSSAPTYKFSSRNS